MAVRVEVGMAMRLQRGSAKRSGRNQRDQDSDSPHGMGARGANFPATLVAPLGGGFSRPHVRARTAHAHAASKLDAACLRVQGKQRSSGSAGSPRSRRRQSRMRSGPSVPRSRWSR